MSTIGGCDQSKYQTPCLRELAWWERNVFIEQPDNLVKQAEGLQWSEHWEDVVVALSLVTGRCLPEVLKMGVLLPKKRYSLWYSAYQEQEDVVLGPFELPTLVDAQQVRMAWQRVRTQVDCSSLSACEICQQYRPAVCECAKRQFATVIPVDEHEDWYAPLYLRIYPLLATRYYCPISIKPTYFGQKVRGCVWPSASSERAWKPSCGQCEPPCSCYVVGDGVNNIDGAQGIKRDDEGVEVPEWVIAPGKKVQKRKMMRSDAQSESRV